MTSSLRLPSPADDSTRWTRGSHVLTRRLPDGVLVLRLPDGQPELVTGPGRDLWDLLVIPHTLPELTRALASRYDHDPVVVRHDLDRTVDELRLRRLVEAAQ